VSGMNTTFVDLIAQNARLNATVENLRAANSAKDIQIAELQANDATKDAKIAKLEADMQLMFKTVGHMILPPNVPPVPPALPPPLKPSPSQPRPPLAPPPSSPLGTFVAPGLDTLQNAVDAASNGETLVLSDGIYLGSGLDVVEISINITIRALNHGLAVLDAEDTRRVIKILSGSTVALIGVNITRGAAQESCAPYASCPQGNTDGSGVFVSTSATVYMRSCSIYSNTGDRGRWTHGGGVFVAARASVEMESCSIHSNKVVSPTGRAYGSCSCYGAHGGGIFVSTLANVRLILCSIHDNEAYHPGSGGGVENRGNLHLESCSIHSNSVSNSVQTCYDGSCNNGIGGGVRNHHGTITMVSSQIQNNIATRGGANLHTSGGSVCTWDTSLAGVSGTTSECAAPP